MCGNRHFGVVFKARNAYNTGNFTCVFRPSGWTKKLSRCHPVQHSWSHKYADVQPEKGTTNGDAILQHASAHGSWRAFRAPHTALESENVRVSFRHTQQHPY